MKNYFHLVSGNDLETVLLHYFAFKPFFKIELPLKMLPISLIVNKNTHFCIVLLQAYNVLPICCA